MFDDALMESGGRIRTRAGWFSGMATLVNGSIVGLLVLWPLLHPAALPRQTLSTMLTAPAPPASPAAAVPLPAAAPTHATTTANPFAAPQRIPQTIATQTIAIKTDPSPTFETGLNPLAVPGAMGAGDVPASIGAAPAVAVRVAPAPAPTKLVLSSGVVAGNKLSGADPVYPAIARAAHVQGVVVLAATISRHGSIENLRVVSGPALLTASALDAVRGWRYLPYLLNGAPVEVETTIRVVFTLGG